MSNFTSSKAASATVNGHKVFIKLMRVGFNCATVSVSVYHRKAQSVLICMDKKPQFDFLSDDWDLPCGSMTLSVDTRSYHTPQEMLEDVKNSINKVIVYIDFDADETLVTQEIYRILG